MNKKKTIQLFLFFVLFFFLPIYLSSFTKKYQIPLLFAYFFLNLVLIVHVINKTSRAIDKVKLKTGDAEEAINVFNDKNSKEAKNQASLKEKIKRYASLKKIIEDLNSSLSPEDISEQLAQITFSMIADNSGTCVLYLVDDQTNALRLYKTKKEDKKAVIKAKQGDIFDYWVLRHSSPLLIEDTVNDFRFDLEKVKNEDLRPVSSLISSPLISGNDLLGVLRLDESIPNFYTQEDLRFLVTVCDLGALALENGILYQNTQELAIHDGLTGLFTKGHFMELLKVETKSSIRHERPFSLAMVDIDLFKNYNDKFGHVAGDIVLKALSSKVAELIKEKLGVVCRFGGEEFCVILPGQDKAAAMKTAESIRSGVEDLEIILRRQETKVSVSIGVSTFSIDAVDETELIMKADKAMYAAKAAGRNCVVGAK
jgi:diguanylate cyclase (GGDEF)-like protein